MSCNIKITDHTKTYFTSFEWPFHVSLFRLSVEVQSNVFYPLNKQLTTQWYLSMYRTNKNNCNRLNQPKSMTSKANIMLYFSLSYISKRNLFTFRIGLNKFDWFQNKKGQFEIQRMYFLCVIKMFINFKLNG